MALQIVLDYLVTFPNNLIVLFSLVSLYWVVYSIYSVFFHHYSDIPGPFWAKVSRLWLAKQVLSGTVDQTQRKLHEKYGSIVRIAPNEVSISDPDAIKTIYAVKNAFSKTDFYTPFAPHLSPNEDLFTQRDEKHHSYRRRFVNNIYSLKSVLESEPFIDQVTAVFRTRLDELAVSGQIIDIGLWLQMYAFDVVGELFYGKQFGFLKNSHDYENYIDSLDALLPALSTICVLPAYVRPLQVFGSLVPQIRKGKTCYDKIVLAAKQVVKERQQLMMTDKVQRTDILDKLFQLSAEKEDFSIPDIETEAWVSIFAGSDTTSIATRSILYHLLMTPDALAKLINEVDNAVADGTLSDSIKHSEAVKLPYLSACCKEGFRVHPSVGMSMPRHVSEPGATICGRYFAPGYRVGMSAAVVHWDKSIFGQDADVYNPDRWLRPEGKDMERHLLHFGAGTRTCIGKNIALAEIYKLIPDLVHRYRFEVIEPEKVEKHSFWFFKQTGFNVRVHRREGVKGGLLVQ
ncbi:hypothetical protein FSOLCH5_011213 [Fusarium solani]